MIVDDDDPRSKMDKQPASMIVQEDSDARLNVSEVSAII